MIHDHGDETLLLKVVHLYNKERTQSTLRKNAFASLKPIQHISGVLGRSGPRKDRVSRCILRCQRNFHGVLMSFCEGLCKTVSHFSALEGTVTYYEPDVCA